MDNHLGAKKDSATQTESPHSQFTGDLSSAGHSGLSAAAPAASLHSPAESPSSVVAGPDQCLYKEPSFAVRDGQDLYHNLQEADASVSCEKVLTPEGTASQQQGQQQQHGRVSAGTQTAMLAIPNTSNRPRRRSQEHAASWTLAGSPAPASPFANAQEEDFTFAGSRGADLPGASSASTQPGTSPGQDSLFALRHNHSSASQQAQHVQQEQRQSFPMADSESTPRTRRSLESADSAYTAMHAERQQAANARRAGAAAPAPSAEPPAQPALHVHAQQEPAGDGASEPTGPYSAASSMVMSPVVGQQVRSTSLPCVISDFSSPDASRQAVRYLQGSLPPEFPFTASIHACFACVNGSDTMAGYTLTEKALPPAAKAPAQPIPSDRALGPRGRGARSCSSAFSSPEEAGPGSCACGAVTAQATPPALHWQRHAAAGDLCPAAWAENHAQPNSPADRDPPRRGVLPTCPQTWYC